MAERRTEIMTFTGTLAGIGIAAATLIASISKSPLSDPWFIPSVAVAAFCTGVFAMAGFSAVPSWIRPILVARRPPTSPEPLIDNIWLYHGRCPGAAADGCDGGRATGHRYQAEG